MKNVTDAKAKRLIDIANDYHSEYIHLYLEKRETPENYEEIYLRFLERWETELYYEPKKAVLDNDKKSFWRLFRGK